MLSKVSGGAEDEWIHRGRVWMKEDLPKESDCVCVK